MRKQNVKEYIECCEEELKELEKRGERYRKQNEKNTVDFIDLTDHYLAEERLRGQIAAAKHILNNC